MPRRSRRSWFAILGLACFSSCLPPTEALTTRDDVPAISAFTWGVKFSDGYVRSQALFGWPLAEVLGHDEQVFITLETEWGDLERVPLRRPDCDVPGVGFVDCDEMHVRLKPGASVDLFNAIPPDRGVRMRHSPVDASVVIGREFGSPLLGFDALRRHPSVSAVEYIRLTELQQPSTDGFTRFWLAGAIPVDRGSRRRRDGRLTISRGERIMLSYQNPNGSVISGTTIVE